MKTVLIIGAGFSGAVTAAMLLRQNRGQPLHLVLINGSGLIARGMAYGTQSPSHTLNVPVGNMSAFDTDQEHFLKFAQQVDPSIQPSSFVSRRMYGDYLEWVLAQSERMARAQTTMLRIARQVTRISPMNHGATEVLLDNGEVILGDQVVLALGHFPSNDPRLPEMSFYAGKRYIRDPWDQVAMDRIGANEPVLLLGTGLTAIDVAMTLLSKDAERPVTAVSRRGLLPQHHRHAAGKHEATQGASSIWGAAATVRTQLRGLRQYCHQLAVEGRDWREAMAILRPITAELWLAYPELERKRFIRHVQPYWDTHRHRLAPQVHEQFSAALQAGTVQTRAARLVALNEKQNGVEVLLQPRGGKETLVMQCAWVINCTGPCADARTTGNPLVEQLLADGLIRTDNLGLGLEVAANCAVVDAHGRVSDSLFYIGPWLKANYWEATAVPDLRRYASKLASSLLPT